MKKRWMALCTALVAVTALLFGSLSLPAQADDNPVSDWISTYGNWAVTSKGFTPAGTENLFAGSHHVVRFGPDSAMSGFDIEFDVWVGSFSIPETENAGLWLLTTSTDNPWGTGMKIEWNQYGVVVCNKNEAPVEGQWKASAGGGTWTENSWNNIKIACNANGPAYVYVNDDQTSGIFSIPETIDAGFDQLNGGIMFTSTSGFDTAIKNLSILAYGGGTYTYFNSLPIDPPSSQPSSQPGSESEGSSEEPGSSSTQPSSPASQPEKNPMDDWTPLYGEWEWKNGIFTLKKADEGTGYIGTDNFGLRFDKVKDMTDFEMSLQIFSQADYVNDATDSINATVKFRAGSETDPWTNALSMGWDKYGLSVFNEKDWQKAFVLMPTTGNWALGRWYDVQLKVVGNHITISANGETKTVALSELGSNGPGFQQGPIVLAASKAGAQFKNVVIKVNGTTYDYRAAAPGDSGGVPGAGDPIGIVVAVGLAVAAMLGAGVVAIDQRKKRSSAA